VEGDVKALEGDMIIKMNIVGEAIVYTKYTVDRYQREWVDLLIDLTKVAGKRHQTRG
jgi:hypothetical protein